MLKLALLFALAAIAFDAIGAALAKIFAFNYGHFALLAILLFIAFGFYAGRVLAPARALMAVVIAAVAEATLGWYVAALIGPARPTPGTAFYLIVAFAVIGVVVDSAAGWAGAFFGHRAARQGSRS